MVSLQAFRILNKNVPKFLKYRGWFLNPRNKPSRVRARFKIEAHAGKLAVRSSLASNTFTENDVCYQTELTYSSYQTAQETLKGSICDSG